MTTHDIRLDNTRDGRTISARGIQDFIAVVTDAVGPCSALRPVVSVLPEHAYQHLTGDARCTEES